MSTQPLPIILCGRFEATGSPVIDLLKPEYEVIHFTTTDEDGILNIPLLLSGKPAQSPSSTLGSANYSAPPVAVVLGGGYDDDQVQKFREAVEATEGARVVPFLKADRKKTAQQSGGKPGPPSPEQIAERVKVVLERLKGEGRLDGRDGGDVWW